MRSSSSQKWLYTHGRNKWDAYYSTEALEWQKSFFDHFLKGEDNGFNKRPPVRLETRRTRQDFDVRSESQWPPERTQYVARYLDLDQARLVAEPPSGPQSHAYDAQSCQTVETSLTFDERTEVTGPMVLKLWASALDADDLDLFVAVRKFDREGREVHFCTRDGYRQGVVALGWLRASQRHLDPQRSRPGRPYLSQDRTEKVRPGEIVPVDIEILASSTIFEAGETLRLVVGGRDILSFARFGHDDTVNHGRHEIHAGGAKASRLLIPLC